ncbi:Transducin (beta)-like 3 [Sparganum proliferum]
MDRGECRGSIVTSDGELLCSRDGEERLEIFTRHLDGTEWQIFSTFNEDITCFYASPFDKTVILATKGLYLLRSSHSKPISIMHMNGTSTRLATGSGDCYIRIWHVGEREGYVASCKAHTSKITLLRFHTSKNLLFSSALGEVDLIVWDSEDGSKVATLVGHQGAVSDIAFPETGSEFVTCGHDKVFIQWSSENFQKVRVFPVLESITSISYLPKGSLVNHLGSSAHDKTLVVTGGQWGVLRVWDTQRAVCTLEVRGPSLFSDADSLNRLGFGLHSVSTIQRFNVPCLPGTSDILMVVRQSSHVEFYNATTLRVFNQFIGEIGPVTQLCLMGRAKNHLVLADASAYLKFFPSPPHCSTSCPGAASWTCRLVQGPHTNVISDLAVSNCGRWLVSGGHDQSLCVWHLEETEKEDSMFARLVPLFFGKEFHDAHLSAVCFSRDSKTVFSASTDGVLKVWTMSVDPQDVPELSDGKLSSDLLREGCSIHNAHTGAINCLHVSVNGKFLATASRDKTAKIWSLGSGKSRDELMPKPVGSLVGHSRGVWSVRFSDFERVALTASSDRDLRLWNLKDFTCIRTLEGHGEPVYRAEFISKGRQILSCDQKGLVRLWNLAKKDGVASVMSSDNSTTPGVLEAHQGRIWALAICPNNQGFYTGGEDATICHFKDKTEETTVDGLAVMHEFIKTQQQLENLCKRQKFVRALHLAVKLDKPQRAFEILQEIDLLEGLSATEGKEHSLFERALLGLVGPVVGSQPRQVPSDELPQRLLKYAVNWNTRARTCLIAQRVFNWIVTHWAPEKLLAWPDMAKTIEAMVPYTVRHYQRFNRLEEQLAVLDYIFDQSRNHQILTWAKSMEMESADINSSSSILVEDEPQKKGEPQSASP